MNKNIKQKIEHFVTYGSMTDFKPVTEIIKQYPKLNAYYILRHVLTGKIYPGSTSDLVKRMNAHYSYLKYQKHPCKDLQKVYNEDHRFECFLVLVNTREEAFDGEQWCLDHYANSGLLLNIAMNARTSATSSKWNIGRKHTSEFREFRSNLHKNKTVSEETKIKMSVSQKGHYVSEKMKEAVSEAHRKSIVINGTKYKSGIEASDCLGIKYTVLMNRVRSPATIWKDWYFDSNI